MHDPPFLLIVSQLCPNAWSRKTPTHLLLEREAERYKPNRASLNTLQHLTHPERETRFCKEVAWSINEETSKLFSYMPLCRANLLQTPQLAVIFCSITAAQLMVALKPSVHYAKGTKKGDYIAYCINLSVKSGVSSDGPKPDWRCMWKSTGETPKRNSAPQW